MKVMKVNSTVVLTLLLLLLMLGSGLVSSMLGFAIGHAALKGVTQPDIRPTNKLAGNKKIALGKEKLVILPEEDILAAVKAERIGKNKASKVDKPKAETTSQKSSAQSNSDSQAGFPIKSESQGVTLQVLSARQQPGSLLLNVSLKNQGNSSVRFLYSFLNVTDDQGNTLSATTDGLPGDLPANGQEFTGTVTIPNALLDDSKKLSLKLTDYPDQKLQLQMSNIPVVK
jgi:hypothetical protein